MSTDTTPLLISAEELASLLGISERTLWRLLSAGQLPQPLRLGRNTRWRLDEIRYWIDSGCPAPSAGKPENRPGAMLRP